MVQVSILSNNVEQIQTSLCLTSLVLLVATVALAASFFYMEERSASVAACEAGHSSVVELLLSSSCIDVEAVCCEWSALEDYKHYTALDATRVYQQFKVEERLRGHTATRATKPCEQLEELICKLRK